jgi:hypothetical protein
MTLKTEYEQQRPKKSRARIYFPSGATVKQVAQGMNKTDKTVYGWLQGRWPVPENLVEQFFELTGYTDDTFATAIASRNRNR